MGLYAVIKGDIVDSVVIADDALETDGQWIDISACNPKPGPNWKYVNGEFVEPSDTVVRVIPPEMLPPQKTEDATAAAIAKLIADGVLKQA
jgi:hypothetical protein